jgi:hypothetical protein
MTFWEHMKSFGLRDERAGHFRRYEKDDLKNLIEGAGFDVLQIISYGFPLPKLINSLIIFLVDKPHIKSMENATTAEKTSLSGISRSEEYKFKKVLPHRLFVLFSKIQRWFYNTDLGIGYVVAARKRVSI